MEENNRTEISGGALLAGAIALGAVAVAAAYRTRALDRVKYRLKRAVEATNLNAFEKSDQGRIRKLVRKYIRRIDKARTKEGAMAAKKAFDEAVAEIGTSARKLADEKLEALGDVYGYAMDKYAYPGGEKVKNTAGKYVDKIRDAATRENVRELRDEFLSRAGRALKKD